ncbi:AzlD domain-containing protein [Patulibacter sp. SYSU D01012]|uniref:branched-chain amino acid transporter permease n=1 Tax=Patulibacter sp. SYSU D01012 TaxID=2817381 RepID=UPI001B303266
MTEDLYLAAAVAIAAGLTFALRAAPFALLGPIRRSATAERLRHRMPVGIMVILVVYLLRDVPVRESPHGLPVLLALAATVGIYRLRGNGTLGVLAGTATYVLLVNLVPGWTP